MTLHDSREEPLFQVLSLPKDYDTNRMRVLVWLSMTYGVGKETGFSHQVRHPSDDQGMSEYFRKYADHRENIRQIIFSHFLPKETFEWIKDDVRQHRWMVFHLIRHEYIDIALAERFKAVLSGRELMIGIIDFRSMSLDHRKIFLDNVKIAWEEHVKQSSLFFWFIREGEVERCNLMWNILKKEQPDSLMGWSQFNGLNDMLLYFDEYSYPLTQVKLWIVRIKRQWSQNLYRQNLEGKKQVNLVLTTKAMNQLDKLAEEFRLSRAKIMEILIHDESKKKIYLNDRQKRYEAFEPTDNAV
jgi:hypothetical protein